MKKFAKIVIYSSLTLVAVFSFNVNHIDAQTFTQCPAGFTCKPILLNPSCPSGYSCKQVSTVTCPKDYFCTPIAVKDCPTGYFCITTPKSVSSSAPIQLRLNSTSPVKHTEVISVTDPTDNIVLAKFDIKSQIKSGVLRGLNVQINTGVVLANKLFENIKITVGGSTYFASSLNSSSARFTDLNVPLPADQFVTITVLGRATLNTDHGFDGVVASASIQANATNIVADDSSFSRIPVTQNVVNGNDITFTSGDVVTIFSGNNPFSKRTVIISPTSETDGVTLLIFNIKSNRLNANLKNLKIILNHSNKNLRNDEIFSNLKLNIGNSTYSADSIGTDQNITFSNLSIPLPVNQYVTGIIQAKIKSNQKLDGEIINALLVSRNETVDVIDTMFNKVNVFPMELQGADVVLKFSYSPVMSNPSVQLGSPVVQNNVTVAQPVTFKFTLTAGDRAVYVSALSNTILNTGIIGYSKDDPKLFTTISDPTVNPGALSGDNIGVGVANPYYVIPAGASRDFTFNGVMKYEPGNASIKALTITGINYGIANNSLTSNTLLPGLSALKAVSTFKSSNPVSDLQDDSQNTASLWDAFKSLFGFQ